MSAFVIAEAGANFKMGDAARDREMARLLIRTAHDAHADAVKFQLYTSKEVYVENAGRSGYLNADINKTFDDYALNRVLVPQLVEYCDAFNVEFICTAFSPAGLDFLNPFVARHKIASYEIGYEALVRAAAKTGKPLIVSTGAATLDDIDRAVHWTFDENAKADITLLHCIAAYPAPAHECNLRGIWTLAETYGPRGCKIGLSDHSEGTIAPIVAVALGAQVIEKHFTLCNDLPGPDHRFAAEPWELEGMIEQIREVEAMLGDGSRFKIQPCEAELAKFAVRSVQATRDLPPGTMLGHEDIAALRPGNKIKGAPAWKLRELVGRCLTRSVAKGDGVCEEDTYVPVVR